MENICKDCDSVQQKVTGTAPPRPKIKQTTLYDHLPTFKNYKRAKEQETVRAEQQRHQKEKEKNIIYQDDSCMIDLEKKMSLTSISRTPVQCPITECERTIGVTSMLSHFLSDHSKDIGLQCQEIYGGNRSVLVFKPATFKFQENICLGVLAYGGLVDKPGTYPGDTGLCMRNAFLPAPHENLAAHLPILIMACKTSWCCLIDDDDTSKTFTEPDNDEQNLIIMWLVSVETTRPLHCTITVYDTAMSASRSTIVRVRHLSESQDANVFLKEDVNYLRLSRGEINILSHNETECIHFEVLINQFT